MPIDRAKARELFLHAVGNLPPDEWDAYVARAGGGDAELEREVGEMLRVHREAGSFLTRPALGATGAFSPASTEETTGVEQPGAVIGPYKLLEQLGEGGFGVVYLAEQTEPVRRKVALKVLRPGMESQQVVARFEAERQALAIMDHPNIARVFDGGVTPSGRPYFVMEWVKGTPITEFCDANHLTPRQRLELFVQVCQAVQHAHQKGVIHRDLKPSNVLVSRHDTTPVVKVIDFGIAKALGQTLTDKTLFTGVAQMVGTPLYMSPEQAGMSDLDVDTRSDVYSLGVLLYELLTGTTPFTAERLKKAAYDEIRRIIREEEPPKPSTRLSESKESLPSISAQRQTEPAKLTRLVRGELDWIVMKALEKDRSRRYETANGFAQDVQRYLADEPVQACPPSAAYRLRKFARRNRKALTVAGLILFLIALLGGGGGWVARDRAAREAEAAHDREARQAKLVGELDLALDRAELFLGQGKQAETLAALDRAELLASEAPTDSARTARLAALKERHTAEVRDQEFIARFEELEAKVIDLQAGLPVAGTYGSIQDRSFTAIQDAFRPYGIDFGTMPPAEAAAVIKSRPESVRGRMVAALTICLARRLPSERSKSDTPKYEQRRQWLLDLLDVADPDDWRVRVRKAPAREKEIPVVRTRDIGATQARERAVAAHQEMLELLAREADVRNQPPLFLVLLGEQLAANRPAREAFLRRIHAAHPRDLRINLALAWTLRFSRPAEAARFLTVAITIRPDSDLYGSRADALLDSGDVDAAVADYRHCIAQDLKEDGNTQNPLASSTFPWHPFSPHPLNDGEIQDRLGEALIVQGRPDEAIAVIREAIRLHRDYWTKRVGHTLSHANSHHNLGAAYACLGQWEKAAAAINEFIEESRGVKMYPDVSLVPGRYLAAALRLQGGDIGSYRRVCQELVKSFSPYSPPRRGSWYDEIIATTCALGPEAVTDFGPVVKVAELLVTGSEKVPQYRAWVLVKGMVEYRAGRSAEAVKWLERFAPNPYGAQYDAMGFAVLAMARHRLGAAEEARAALVGARSIIAARMPDPARGRLFRADVIPLNHHGAAENFSKSWDQRFGPEHWLPWVHVQILWREAEELLNEFGGEKQDSRILLSLGQSYYRAGNWKAARTALVKSVERGQDPEDGLAGFFLAMAHWQVGEKDEARKWYDRAVGRMSVNEELWRVRAEAAALLGIGHPLPPFAEVRKAIDQAHALADQGQWQKAAAEYARAADAFPGDAGLWVEYAGALLLADDPEGYRRASADILRRLGAVTDPVTCYCLARIASLAPEGGDPAEAVKRAEKGVAAHAKQACFLHTLAVAHYRVGQFDQAVRRAEQSLKDDPGWGGHVVDWLVLALAHQRLGHDGEARQWLDKAAKWIDQAGKGLPKESRFALPVPSWGDRLEIQLLRREAEKLIGGK